MNFRGFLIIKRGTIFITRAGEAKHKIKFQWPNLKIQPKFQRVKTFSLKQVLSSMPTFIS